MGSGVGKAERASGRARQCVRTGYGANHAGIWAVEIFSERSHPDEKGKIEMKRGRLVKVRRKTDGTADGGARDKGRPTDGLVQAAVCVVVEAVVVAVGQIGGVRAVVELQARRRSTILPGGKGRG